MTEEKKYQGYGYHGGGRKPTGVKRESINISGQPEELQKLKDLAKEAGMTTSAYILSNLDIRKGVRKMKKLHYLVMRVDETKECFIRCITDKDTINSNKLTGCSCLYKATTYEDAEKLLSKCI